MDKRECILKGRAAAPGFAVGVAFELDHGEVERERSAGSMKEEGMLFSRAVKDAAEGLACLASESEGLGAEILEFQMALLEDDDLLGPVREAICEGTAADLAWRAAVDNEIENWKKGDETIAARAADLHDLRDRVLQNMVGARAMPTIPDNAIVVARDIAPSRFLSMDWHRLGGAALFGGSPTSHVAILARSRGVPMLVGIGLGRRIGQGETLALDAAAGALYVSPSAATLAAFSQRRDAEQRLDAQAAQRVNEPAATATGKPVRVMLNINQTSELDRLSPAMCDGIGLVRTEFLFAAGPPDEQLQYEDYSRIVEWAQGRPVTIRLLDAGGDKPIPGVTIDGEANPFLGTRGIRLLLLRPEIFRVQLRALARAAELGPLKIMVPMVTVPQEFAETRMLLESAIEELAAEGIGHGVPSLGMMVEVPAAALTAEQFDAAFFSIGSNDLAQYTMAVARDLPGLARLADAGSEAVLELIRRTVDAGKARGIEVSLCGDLASQPDQVAALLKTGLDTLSVAPSAVARVKLAISATEV
jgi:phosphoenolpyruvate-protein phosphotransferase (PTS system enzyme I)